MNSTLIAEASVTIHAPASRVWDALTNPTLIKQYFFGSEVISDWQEGSPIIYQGDYQGTAYRDKGQVLKVEPEKYLLVTHWSPLSGTADSPENYHRVSYRLAAEHGATRLTITQDNNASQDEQQHNSANWKMVLEALKKLLEG